MRFALPVFLQLLPVLTGAGLIYTVVMGHAAPDRLMAAGLTGAIIAMVVTPLVARALVR